MIEKQESNNNYINAGFTTQFVYDNNLQKSNVAAVIYGLWVTSEGKSGALKLPNADIVLATTNIIQMNVARRLLDAGFVPVVRWQSRDRAVYEDASLPANVLHELRSWQEPKVEVTFYANWVTLWVKVQKEITNALKEVLVPGAVHPAKRISFHEFTGCCQVKWLMQVSVESDLEWESALKADLGYRQPLMVKVAPENGEWEKVLAKHRFKYLPLSTQSTWGLWYRCMHKDMQAKKNWPELFQDANAKYMERFKK